MGNVSKRFLSMLVAFVMVFTMIPATVFASGYDVSTMTDQEVADLVMQLEAEGDYDAIEEIAAQLDEDRLEAVDALLMEQQEHTPSAQAENTATVTAYKQVSYATNKVVDAKYFEAVGTAANVQKASDLIKATGAAGGLIEISAGTLVVSDIQDITMSNIIVKGAGKDLTTITGDATAFNNGLKSSSIGEFKGLLRVGAYNDVKIMDMTIDGGGCGFWNIKYILDGGYADFKVVRLNGGATAVNVYLENVTISGSKARATLMVGTSDTVVNAYAVNTTVNKAATYTTEVVDGSTFNTVGSILDGAVLGNVGGLGEGYYKITHLGTTAYTTIPYAIECYENGTFSSSMLNSSLVDSGVTVVEAMTNDLTTITATGTPKLLYGYNCAEMRQLAADFRTALLGLSSDADVDALAYLTQLTTALATEQWHTVEADGSCSTCGATGLEVPTPEIEVEVPSVEEILPEDVTEEEKEVVETVVEQIKQNTALEGFVPENLAQGSTLSIKLTAVNVNSATAPNKFTYDVKPVDTNGAVTAPTGFVTFRLPIPASVTKTLASVYHNGTLMGTYPIYGTGNGKYVEVTTDSFSEFTVEPEEAPKANVTVMDPILLTPEEHDYMCYPSGSGSETIDRPLQIVMNFKAIDTLEECLAGKFSKYLVDFYLKVEGLASDTLTTEGCYLAGFYGDFGWVVIPADEFVLEEGVSYPVVSGYDATLNYKDICNSVKDFTAAIHISEEILEANPDFKITLELRMTNPNDSSNVLVVGEPATYTVADLKAGMAFLGKYQEVKDEHVENIDNVNTNTTIDEEKHETVIEAAKDTLLGAGFTQEQVENATTDVVISFVKMDYVENQAPAKVTYKVTPMIKVGDYEQKISTFDEPVTFRLPVSADETCTTAKVYHEGELMGIYTIKTDGETKYVEVSSKNFSNFTVEPVSEFDAVAKIGDTYYETLQDAINAANGKVVTLIADIELTDTVTVPAGVTMTLELNGHTISQTKEQTSGYQMILNDGNLTIQDSVGDGKISYTDSGNGGEYVSNTITNRGTLTLKSGTIENMSSAAVADAGYPYAIDTSIWGAADEVNTIIEGGKVYCESYSALRLRADSETEPVNITITGGEVYGRIEVQNPSSNKATVGELTITGGTIDKNNSSKAIMIFGGGGTAENMTVAISGGSITGPIGYSSYFPIENFDEEIISGGTFSADVSDFVADGFELTDNGNGTFGVEVDPAYGKVAKIGDTYYESLAEAIKAAVDGDTITLLADVVLNGQIKVSNKSFTIEGNGNSITGSGNLWLESGTFTINNVVFENITNSTVAVLQFNYATATVSGCTFTGNSSASCIAIGYNADGDDTSVVTIDGCEFTDNTLSTSVLNFAEGNTTLKNSTVTGNTANIAVIYNSGNCTVTGNSFSGNTLTGTNANKAVILTGPYTAGTFAVDITENAFQDAAYVSVYVEDWFEEYGATSSNTLSGNYWGTENEPVAGTNYIADGDNVTLESYYATYEDGTLGDLVEIEEEPEVSVSFYGATLLFESEIKLNFYLTVMGITGDFIPNGGVEIWSEDAYDAANLLNPTTVLTGLTKNKSYYQITTAGIAAKDMGEMIYVRAFIEVDGEKVYSDVISYSPVKYAKYHIDEAVKDPGNAQKMKNAKLCIALMNYGAAAQKYFAGKGSYTYTTLMNSFITEEQQGWLDGNAYKDPIAVNDDYTYNWPVADESVIKLYGASGVFEGALQMKLYATVGVVGTVKMYYWTEATAGNELLIENATEMTDVGKNDVYYQGHITDIAAKNAGDTLYICAAVEVDGVTYYTKAVSHSLHKYAAEKMDEMADLAVDFIIYSNVVKEYLGNKT